MGTLYYNTLDKPSYLHLSYVTAAYDSIVIYIFVVYVTIVPK